jgi:hypothetical protein
MSSHLTLKTPLHMTLKIHIMDYDRHKHVVGLTRLMGMLNIPKLI